MKTTYRSIMRGLTTMTESELQRALDYELATERRLTVAERLHQRLCIVRARRERDELLKELKQ